MLQPASNGSSAATATARVEAASADRVKRGRKRKEKGVGKGEGVGGITTKGKVGKHIGAGDVVLLERGRSSRKGSKVGVGRVAELEELYSGWLPVVTAHTPRIKCQGQEGILRRDEQFYGGWGVYYSAADKAIGGSAAPAAAAAADDDDDDDRGGHSAADIGVGGGAPGGNMAAKLEASEASDDASGGGVQRTPSVGAALDDVEGEWLAVAAKDFPRHLGIKSGSWKRVCLVEHAGDWVPFEVWYSAAQGPTGDSG